MRNAWAHPPRRWWKATPSIATTSRWRLWCSTAWRASVMPRACDDRFAQPVLGCLPSDPRLELPERHLGLVQAAELPALERFLDGAADIVADTIDLARLRRIMRPFGLGLY